MFKHTNTLFKIKSPFDCNSSNLIYVIICPNCKEEYIGETGENNTRLRDRVRVYRQHIKDAQYQMNHVEEHLRICGKGDFKIFPLLQIRCDNTDFRRMYEKLFINKFKVTLNRKN